MKKRLLILAAVAACNCSEDYTITGILNTNPADSVYLYSNDDMRPLATAHVADNGSFQLHGTIEDPMIARFTEGRDPLAIIFLEKGDIRIIHTPETGYAASGTPLNDRLRAINVTLHRIITATYTLGTEAADSLAGQYTQTISDAVSENTDNLLGAYIFANHEFARISPYLARQRLTQFPKSLRKSAVLSKVTKTLEAIERTETGQTAPNLILPDTSGQMLSLSSFKGKWILIQFWATWSTPSRKEISILKEVYSRYEPKGFTIFCVSLDNDKETWKRYLFETNPQWPNTLGVEQGQSSAAQLYGVTSVPANFLIGPDGRIAAKFLSADELKCRLDKEILP